MDQRFSTQLLPCFAAAIVLVGCFGSFGRGDRCGMCHRDASCEIVAGDAVCRCPPGFVGDGTECEAQDVAREAALLQHPAPASAQEFGVAVDFSDDGAVLVVGGQQVFTQERFDVPPPDHGGAVVFRRADGGWAREQVLAANDAFGLDVHSWGFGGSVAISGDGSVIAVAAEGDSRGGAGIGGADPAAGPVYTSGAVLLYRRSAGTWTLEADIKAPREQTDAFFGRSVALDREGSTLVVGAEWTTAGDVRLPIGAAYVYLRRGGRWALHEELSGPPEHTHNDFGGAVSLSADGDVLAVGAVFGAREVGQLLGSVSIFRRGPTGWTREGFFESPRDDVDRFFGRSVSLSGDGRRLVVGEPYLWSLASRAATPPPPGRVHEFRRDDDGWVAEGAIPIQGAARGDATGYSVRLSGDGGTLVVGAPRVDDGELRDVGRAYVARWTGERWAFLEPLGGSSADMDHFGSAVAVDERGTVIAVGSFLEEVTTSSGSGGDQTIRAGVVRVYR